MTTVLLTGIPRGGTTLACELLNRLADARALDEPMRPGRFIREATRADGTLDHQPIISAIQAFAGEQRRSLLERGVAVSKHVQGSVIGAKVSDDRGADGQRRKLREHGETFLGVPSSPAFTLAIKHPVAFTALLDVLLPVFPVAALVRNPLAIVASWETMPMVVRDGAFGLPPVAAPALAERLAAQPERLDRQVELLAWFYESYREKLPAERVIRYEDVVATGGTALAPVVASARTLDVPLRSRNAATDVYDAGHMAAMAHRLLAREPGQWAPYRHEDIELLLQAIGGASSRK
jgi:hypothetical protein